MRVMGLCLMPIDRFVLCEIFGFMKENGQIVTLFRLDEEIEQIFELPHYLDATKFDENTDPLYMLPAV